MADFVNAYDLHLRPFEGGLVNDPQDPGGITWRGITMRDHSQWPGWARIADLLGMPIKEYLDAHPVREAEGKIKADGVLEFAVLKLYKTQYWDPWWGDRFPVQAIAEEVLESHVNTGRGVEFLQAALNKLNWTQNGLLWPELTADNRMGANTWAVLLACLKNPSRGARRLYNLQNVRQGLHYWQLQDKRESFEKFIGWYERVEHVKWMEPDATKRFAFVEGGKT